MKILVDGETKNWEFDNEKTLEEVMIEANQRLMDEDGRVIVEIKLDECDEGLDPELTWDKVSVGKIVQVSLKSETLAKQVDDALVNGLKYLEDSRDSVKSIVGDMLAGEIGKANDTLRETIEKLLGFFDLLSQLENDKIVNLSDEKVKEESFKDFVVRFNTTLKEIAESMEKGDTTLINDFLEYELEPAIGDLMELVPALRKTVAEKADWSGE